MTAIHYELRPTPAPHAAASADGIVDGSYAGARRRLTLAVLWLAALVAWGLFSSLTSDLPSDRSGSVSVRGAQPFDGHGKWTGY